MDGMEDVGDAEPACAGESARDTPREPRSLPVREMAVPTSESMSELTSCRCSWRLVTLCRGQRVRCGMQNARTSVGERRASAFLRASRAWRNSASFCRFASISARRRSCMAGWTRWRDAEWQAPDSASYRHDPARGTRSHPIAPVASLTNRYSRTTPSSRRFSQRSSRGASRHSTHRTAPQLSVHPRPSSLDEHFVDYDGVRFRLSTPERKTLLRLSMNIRCWNELERYGAQNVLAREYGTYLLPQAEPEYSVTLEFDTEQVPPEGGAYAHHR